MKPKRDITGGTVLRIPAIQSPDFQSDVAGWEIAQDGSAQFNNVTLIGSIVLTSSKTILIYSSATPATGTLVISISPVAGSDLFGNAYPAGLAFYDGSENQIATLDPVNGLSLNGHGGAQSVSLTDVPIYVQSASGTAPSLAGNITDVTGLIFAAIPTLRIMGPTMGAATDSKTSRVSIVLTGGNTADAAQGLLQFESTDSGGLLTVLTWTKNAVTSALPLVASSTLAVTGKTTLSEQAKIASADVNGALSINQSVPTTGNPGTISHQESAAGNGAYGVFVNGDGHARFVWDSNGKLRWGPGNAGLDNALARIAANLLGIAGSLLIAGTAALGDNGVGELQLANATTEPTTNPTGGLVLYAKGGVPKVRDPGGNLLGMVRSYSADASADLLAFTTEADITGATVSVVVQGGNATVKVWAQFDMQLNGTAATLIGFLNWNGSDRSEQAIFTVPTAGARMCISRSWRITGVTAGTYTAKLRASCTVNNGSNGVRTTHTGIMVEVEEG